MVSIEGVNTPAKKPNFFCPANLLFFCVIRPKIVIALNLKNQSGVCLLLILNYPIISVINTLSLLLQENIYVKYAILLSPLNC